MAITRNPLRYTISDGPRRAEERLGGRLIVVLAQQHIFELRFVTVPAAPHRSAPLLTESLAQQGSQFGFPFPYGLMRQYHTPSRDISARSRTLSLSRTHHSTTRQLTSGGYWRRLKTDPVCSLQPRP